MKVCQSALRGYKNVRLRFLQVVRLESKLWNAESCSELLQVIQPQGCFRGKCDSSTVIDGQHRMRASSGKAGEELCYGWHWELNHSSHVSGDKAIGMNASTHMAVSPRFIFAVGANHRLQHSLYLMLHLLDTICAECSKAHASSNQHAQPATNTPPSCQRT